MTRSIAFENDNRNTNCRDIKFLDEIDRSFVTI